MSRPRQKGRESSFQLAFALVHRRCRCAALPSFLPSVDGSSITDFDNECYHGVSSDRRRRRLRSITSLHAFPLCHLARGRQQWPSGRGGGGGDGPRTRPPAHPTDSNCPTLLTAAPSSFRPYVLCSCFCKERTRPSSATGRASSSI